MARGSLPPSADKKGPGVLANGLGMFLCSSLALAALTVLVEGVTQGSFGRVRYYGTVTLPDRPVAFGAVAVGYAAGMIFSGRGAWILLKRLRGRLSS